MKYLMILKMAKLHHVSKLSNTRSLTPGRNEKVSFLNVSEKSQIEFWRENSKFKYKKKISFGAKIQITIHDGQRIMSPFS